jgi:hypothetical protein
MTLAGKSGTEEQSLVLGKDHEQHGKHADLLSVSVVTVSESAHPAG